MCTKNKSNLSTVQRETQRQNFAQIYPLIFAPDTNILCIVSSRFTFCTSAAESVTDQWKVLNWERISFFYQQKSEVIMPIKEGICYCLVFVQSYEKIQRWNADKQKHRFHSDNLPIHSAKCSCYEYDGVLLLIIIITVMVIINNYLMMWCSFTWWDLSVYCF